MHAQASESGMCPGRARVNIYLLQIIPLEVAIGYKKQIEPIEFDSLDTKSPQLLFPRFQLLFPRFQLLFPRFQRRQKMIGAHRDAISTLGERG